MIFSDCLLALRILFSMVLLLLPFGHFISHTTPFIRMSGLLILGLLFGG